MNVNINVPRRALTQIARALNRIANAYETVHAKELRAARYDHHEDKQAGRTFYQDDKEIWKAEREAEARQAAADGLL